MIDVPLKALCEHEILLCIVPGGPAGTPANSSKSSTGGRKIVRTHHLIVVVILTVAAGPFACEPVARNESSLPENPFACEPVAHNELSLPEDPFELLSEHRLELVEHTVSQYDTALARYRTWEVNGTRHPPALLYVMEYALPGRQYYYHIRLDSAHSESPPILLRLNLSLGDFSYRYLQYGDVLSNHTSSWSEPVSGEGEYISLPLSSVFLDSPEREKSAYLSYVTVFSRMAKSVLREEQDASTGVVVTPGGLLIQLPQHKGSYAEHWGLWSEACEPLMRWEDPEVIEVLQIADLTRVRRWSRDGMYYRTLPGHYPTGEHTFYMNAAHHVGERFLRVNGAGQFFPAFALVSLHTAVRTQTEQGYWTTGPGSEWLYELYGLGGGLYDTRWSTHAALFLLKGYREFGDDRFLIAAEKYAEFFVEYVRLHHYLTDGGGYLVWDYGDPRRWGEVPTHVSLNHQLAEMNFLYEMYVETRDEHYRSWAEKLLKAVQDTAHSWIRDSGDLWYAYMPDGTFQIDDYPLLTLRDLRYSQRLHLEVYGTEHPDLGLLLRSKVEYLSERGLPLY